MTLVSIMFLEKVSHLRVIGLFLPRAQDWAPVEPCPISHLLLLTSTSVCLSVDQEYLLAKGCVISK